VLFTALAQTAVTTETRRRFELAGVPNGWSAALGLLVLAGLLYALVWLYRHDARASVSPRGRWVLVGLRSAVILALALIWLEPVLGVYTHRRTLSRTLVLVDASASMAIRDRYADAATRERITTFLNDHGGPADEMPDRAALAHRLLTADNAAFLDGLARKNRVEIFAFDEFPRHRDTLVAPGLMTAADIASSQPADAGSTPGARSPAEMAPIEPTGPVTNVGRGVREAIAGAGSAPVAGVVILSDGAVNQGEPVDVVGRFARARQIPLYVVGIGDPSPPRNVRITELLTPQTAFVRDPFAVTAHISNDGMAGERVSVELILRGEAEGGAPRVLETRRIDMPPSGEMTPVTFRHAINQAGEVTLAVRVPEQDGEVLTDDNQREAKVRILEDKLRVLLVAGGPSWEYRYLSRLLERDDAFDVSCWLQSADVDAVRDGNTIIDHLPTEPAELFDYDVVLLMDPDPTELTETWCKNVATLVGDHFGGIALAAGRKFTPRFMRSDAMRSVVELLPILYDPEAELEINRQGHYQRRAWPITIPDAARDHPVVTQTTDPAVNASIWSRLGEIYWHYPVRRHKPLATVLMRHTNPLMRDTTDSGEATGQVLLAAQRFGTGRSAFLAIDSTWRWRRFGDRYFNRFWVQLIRYVSEGKSTGQQRRGLILTDRERYRMGEAVTVRPRLLDHSYMPLTGDTFQATLRETPAGDAAAATDRPLVLQANPTEPGWFQGRFVARRVGSYEISAEFAGEVGEDALRVSRTVRVTRPEIELARPQLDRDALETLAETSGGAYFTLDQADEIPDRIESQHAETVTAGTPIVLWDSVWTLVVLVGLVGVEWALRKRWRLL